jgi:hypothetical protein
MSISWSVTETVLFVELDWTVEGYAEIYLTSAALGPSIGVSEEEVRRWRAELGRRTAAGTFYFALPWTYVLGRK